jgi:glycine/D-amino acid oxidase-like deaminating enzyme
MREEYDAIVIGGGFYGCTLAAELGASWNRVALLEAEPGLMERASYVNQARVHNGCHYPRSYLTAVRSAANFPRFAADYRECIDDTFEQIYAIARNNSKVSGNQFRKFCEVIGAPLRRVPDRIRSLFNPDLIEDAFSVTEFAFDAAALRRNLEEKLDAAGVSVFCGAPVEIVSPRNGGRVAVRLKDGTSVTAGMVFNCAYSGINGLLRRSGLTPLPLKHELAEVALVEVPEALAKVGITVMDGPFFSTMPFPARRMHSLTHVRYTPHRSWSDAEGATYAPLPEGKPQPNYPYMLRDAQRYVPALQRSRHQCSLFEVKSVLIQNEVDDGRPILLRKNYGFENFSVVMGSKIDNIYDALQALSAAGLIERMAHA